MIFSIGDILEVDGSEYKIVGKVTYRNTVDNCCWDEYRMISTVGRKEAWLSIDETYKEYSISHVVLRANLKGFHEVDRGREVVMSASGNVDVEYGDAAFFVEYEDSTEEKIISEETWDDGAEYSEGYYLDEDEIRLVSSNSQTAGSHTSFSSSNSQTFSSGGYQHPKKMSKVTGIAVAVILILVISMPLLVSALNGMVFKKSISKYLEEDSGYTYSTSITGQEQQKADVYEAVVGNDVDTVAKDIINAINGETEYVQEDSESSDGSVAILTNDEYCIVYPSEEDDTTILVQVSNRKYAYTSDNDLYHGSSRSRRYFRRFYYSTGYSSDSDRYSDSSSPYSSFSDSAIDYNSSNTYSTYSGSVRQSSIRSRSSSGGGLSSGK